ncbi:MAG: H+-transporting two-sector ATPase, subunit [Candidatus Angelobacter sp.]|jgi:F-type H+-transporting ATPase subunit b|nr:H+-transporting two-sector ATPase, subunit [Candidatus Angelobacter sp.]
MDAALQKALGELLLAAVPTICMFVVLYLAYRVLVHNPLMKVLADRHTKTEGAIAKAQADIAAAEAKTAEYEARLREARLATFKAQEARRKQLLEALSTAIAEARAKAETQVKAAREEIQKEAAVAKSGLQAQAESLAAEVIRSVLKLAGQQAPAAGAQ